jgi:hypothetical protein
MNPDAINRIANSIAIALGLAAILFFVAIFLPQFQRRLGRVLERIGLGRVVLLDPSVWQVLLWSLKSAEAMLQVTKAYDWRVSQWTGFATGVMTATLAFVSAIVIEYFKDTIKVGVPLLKIATLGVLASCLVYLMAQRRVTLLKNQFLETYGAVVWLNRRQS